MILYTGWLSTNNASLNGNLWVTGAETQSAFGYIGLGVLAIAIIMGIFTGLNGFLMSASRLLFSMGRSGIMPTAFSKLHSKYKTPYVAIIFLVAVTLIAPWLGRTALTWIVDMSSTGVSIAYFITCLSALSCSVLIKKVIRTDLFIRHLPFWFDCIIYFPSVIVSAWITSIALNAVIYCFRWMVSNWTDFLRYPLS